MEKKIRAQSHYLQRGPRGPCLKSRDEAKGESDQKKIQCTYFHEGPGGPCLKKE